MEYVESAAAGGLLRLRGPGGVSCAREGEWCCEECEHLLERFVCVESRAETDT